jgi:hypothetical protein
MPQNPVITALVAEDETTQAVPISIVIPAFNEARYIGDCLASLEAQTTRTPYEVIVVDNGSTDATASIARTLGATVTSESRQGVCWARQAGLELANGHIVVSADADTCYPATWLERIEQSFSDPTVVAAAGPVRFVDAPLWARAWTSVLFGFVALWARVFGRPPYVSACNLAFRKAAFDGYDTRLTQGGDELYVLRTLKARGKIVFDSANCVHTSSRRLARGFLYTVVVTLVLLYLVEYGLSRITRRSLFGSYPVIRDPQVRPARLATVGLTVAAAMFIGVVLAGFWAVGT